MQKTAKYRRTIWLNGQNSTLQELLLNALQTKPTVQDTLFDYRGASTIQISQRRENDDGYTMCYFTLFSKGKQAGTVEDGGEGIDRVDAPNGQEFLKTGIHMAVSGDHIGLVTNGMTNDGQLTGLLLSFLRHAGLPNNQLQFSIMPRADRGQIENLLADGVKSLDLGLADFITAIDDQNDSSLPVIERKIQGMQQSVAALFANDRTPEEIEAAANLEASIHIGFDGRGAGPLVAQVLASVADDIASDNTSQFKIITKSGDVITQDNLVISSVVNVNGDEVALDHISTFTELRRVMKDWRNRGMLD